MHEKETQEKALTTEVLELKNQLSAFAVKEAKEDAFVEGKKDGFSVGREDGRIEGLKEGYEAGHQEGVEEGRAGAFVEGFNQRRLNPSLDGKLQTYPDEPAPPEQEDEFSVLLDEIENQK
ncbi:UNVERIFIED_CONTAM: hypothetical protein Sindi_0731900 [Sesamum indicum]